MYLAQNTLLYQHYSCSSNNLPNSFVYLASSLTCKILRAFVPYYGAFHMGNQLGFAVFGGFPCRVGDCENDTAENTAAGQEYCENNIHLYKTAAKERL